MSSVAQRILLRIMSQPLPSPCGLVSWYFVPGHPRGSPSPTIHRFPLNLVLAIQRGNQCPNRYVLLSGDMDSRASNSYDGETDAPGANHNVSGMVGTLEAARLLTKHTFPASVVYAGLSAEEPALRGGGCLLTNRNIAIILSSMSIRPLIRAIDPAALAKAADVIKVVGHPDRLRILEFLEERERCVGEIQEVLDLPQAIVSQHLARLRGWNIVEARRDGIHVFYHVVEPKVKHILDCIRRCDLGDDGTRER